MWWNTNTSVGGKTLQGKLYSQMYLESRQMEGRPSRRYYGWVYRSPFQKASPQQRTIISKRAAGASGIGLLGQLSL